jgi:hypothetical protein
LLQHSLDQGNFRKKIFDEKDNLDGSLMLGIDFLCSAGLFWGPIPRMDQYKRKFYVAKVNKMVNTLPVTIDYVGEVSFSKQNFEQTITQTQALETKESLGNLISYDIFYAELCTKKIQKFINISIDS